MSGEGGLRFSKSNLTVESKVQSVAGKSTAERDVSFSPLLSHLTLLVIVLFPACLS